MTTAVTAWGEPGNRQCVLLHGITGSSLSWAGIAPTIASDGYHVLAPDLPGHGHSRLAPPPPDQVSLARMLARLTGRRPDLLVGHSFGGTIAVAGIAAGVWEPQALVLEDPVITMPSRQLAASIFESATAFRPRSLADVESTNSRLNDLEAGMSIATSRMVDKNAVSAEFVDTAPWDLSGQLTAAATRIPTLLLIPGEHHLYSDLYEKPIPGPGAARAGLPCAVEFPNSGHDIHREHPHEFMAAIRTRLRVESNGRTPEPGDTARRQR